LFGFDFIKELVVDFIEVGSLEGNGSLGGDDISL
jgi:hypothetical protein